MRTALTHQIRQKYQPSRSGRRSRRNLFHDLINLLTHLPGLFLFYLAQRVSEPPVRATSGQCYAHNMPCAGTVIAEYLQPSVSIGMKPVQSHSYDPCRTDRDSKYARSYQTHSCCLYHGISSPSNYWKAYRQTGYFRCRFRNSAGDLGRFEAPGQAFNRYIKQGKKLIAPPALPDVKQTGS